MAMNLVIDIGNSLVKLAVFRGSEIVHKMSVKDLEPDMIENRRKSFPGLDRVILSSVGKPDPSLVSYLERSFEVAIQLDQHTPLPVINAYETPETLGYDRLAAAAGANTIFPDSDVLIIDIGSAITFDFINRDNRYLGGNISPGMQMRFRALNEYTSNLPLIEPGVQGKGFGKNTTEAIRRGVQCGIIHEIDGFIDDMKSEYADLKIIITGGDCSFFDNSLKNSIFVDLNLTLKGLNRILEYNA